MLLAESGGLSEVLNVVAFALGFLSMLIGVVAQAVLARANIGRNRERIEALEQQGREDKSELAAENKELRRRLESVERWREREHGAALARRDDRTPVHGHPLEETSTQRTREFRK